MKSLEGKVVIGTCATGNRLPCMQPPPWQSISPPSKVPALAEHWLSRNAACWLLASI